MKLVINIPKGFSHDLEITLNVQGEDPIVDVKPVTNSVPVAERIAPTTIQVHPNANTAPAPAAPVVTSAEVTNTPSAPPVAKQSASGGFVNFSELNNVM